MSPKARMIMYPLLAVVVAFFVYTTFFMDKSPKPATTDEATTTEQVQVQVQTTESEDK